MAAGDWTISALDAIGRAFAVARVEGHSCGPADFLVGIAEGEGAAATALNPPGAAPLREAATAERRDGTAERRDGTAERRDGHLGRSYLHMQVQGAALSLAAARDEQASAEHLLLALIDQGRPEVLAVLRRAGRDPAAVRRMVLAALGLADDYPPLPLPPLAAVGTMDRPPLPVAQLDSRLWAVLAWRQAHLPLGLLHGRQDAQALARLEDNAVWAMADRLRVDEDQRYSALRHHRDRVMRLIGEARPDLSAPPPRRPMPHRRSFWPLGLGLDAWLSNRRANARLRLLRLRTRRAYRDCPAP